MEYVWPEGHVKSEDCTTMLTVEAVAVTGKVPVV